MRSGQPLHRLVGRNDVRFDLAQILIRQAPTLKHSRGQVGEEDVRALDQP